MSGHRIRCMGPWPACKHAEGTCTSSPDYQAAIAAMTPTEPRGGEAWTGPGTERHVYSPNAMMMGDCDVCGHTAEAHNPRPRPPVVHGWPEREALDEDDDCLADRLLQHAGNLLNAPTKTRGREEMQDMMWTMLEASRFIRALPAAPLTDGVGE